MKEILLRFGRREHWKLYPADLTERTDELENPARGWYQIYTFQAEKEPDYRELEWCLNGRDTLALVMIDIGSYRDKPLDDECIARMGKILNFFEENGYDVVLRIVYDHEGKALEREPFFFEQVQRHIAQLGPVFKEHADSIFVFQGLLVGNWGEMHTSRFLKEDMLRRMTALLRSHRGKNTYLAVRTPAYWRMLHHEEGSMGAQKETVFCSGEDMGLFDDGMFGSDSHLGTFGIQPGSSAAWKEPWSREDELVFEERLCRTVPNGGEAVWGEELQGQLTKERVLGDLRQMHITYLNRVYDSRLLDIFRQWKCKKAGVWQEKSVFDYIGAHLGYRFIIRKAVLIPDKRKDIAGRLEVALENTGFAALYQEAQVFLETVDAQGNTDTKKLDWDLRSLGSGETKIFSCLLEAKKCRIFLYVRRSRDGRDIRFANGSCTRGGTELGMLEVET